MLPSRNRPVNVTLPSEIAALLRRGTVIPAHPLALDARRKLDARRQRALTRYYLDAGVPLRDVQIAARHADPRTTMEPLPRWPEKSARTGARPHSGSTSQQPVSEPHFSTDHNPANRNNAP